RKRLRLANHRILEPAQRLVYLGAVGAGAGGRMITRRDFVAAAAAPLMGAPAEPHAILDRYWLPILDGFLRNAAKTSPSMAVCDFPDGTILMNSIGQSGKTYDSVTRMMPALVAWVASGRARPELIETLRKIFRNALDPQL